MFIMFVGEILISISGMSIITFNKVFLIEETTASGSAYVSPKTEDLIKIKENFEINNDNKDDYIKVNVLKEDEFLWFHFRYGSPNPRDEFLTDTGTGEKIENPRKDTEAELIHQYFVLYHYDTSTVYISNSKKTSGFIKILNDQLKKNYVPRRVYKDIDGFLEVINSVSEMSFTDVSDLFNQNSKQRQALTDLTGTNSPDSFTIKAKYSKKTIKKFLKQIDQSSQGLMIKGLKDDGFSVIYNQDSFLEAIKISVTKKDNGMYDPNEVKNELLELI